MVVVVKMNPAGARLLFEESVGRWSPDLAARCGWTLHCKEYPIVDCEFRKEGRTPLRIHMDLHHWDEKPPSISLRDSEGNVLKTLLPNPSNVFNAGPHRHTGLPFICMKGSLEFHTHEGHLNEPWEQFRGKPGFDIGDILYKLWDAWLEGSG